MYKVVVDGLVIAKTETKPTIVCEYKWHEVAPTLAFSSGDVRIELDKRFVGFINGNTIRPLEGVCLAACTKPTNENALAVSEEAADVKISWCGEDHGSWLLRVYQKER